MTGTTAKAHATTGKPDRPTKTTVGNDEGASYEADLLYQRTLIILGSITVRLVFSYTALDSAKEENMLFFV